MRFRRNGLLRLGIARGNGANSRSSFRQHAFHRDTELPAQMAFDFVLQNRPHRCQQQIVDACDQEDFKSLESRGADGLRHQEHLAHANDAQEGRVFHQRIELVTQRGGSSSLPPAEE